MANIKCDGQIEADNLKISSIDFSNGSNTHTKFAVTNDYLDIINQGGLKINGYDVLKLSNNENGKVITYEGIMFLWGNVTVKQGQMTPINFPIPYLTTDYGIGKTPLRGGTSNETYDRIRVFNATTSGFEFANAGYDMEVHYIVVGKVDINLI